VTTTQPYLAPASEVMKTIRLVAVGGLETQTRESGGTKKLSEVSTVSPDDSLYTAVDLISHEESGSVLVVENGVPVGIVTERDILKLALDDLRSYHVRDVMSSPLIVIDLEHLPKALTKMSDRNIRHLPVVKRGRLVGILTHR